MKTTLFALLFFVSSIAIAQVKGIEHVVLIGTDGFGAFMFKEHKGSFPNIEQLMKEGSSSMTMRSVLPSSSAVNWASILMGAGPELHGYTEWGSRTPELPSREIGPYGIFPGIFGLVRQQKPKAETAVVYSWEGIGYLFEKDAVNDVKECKDDDLCVLDNGLQFLAKKPVLSFIYFSEPDGAGHGKGWGTPEYLAACKKIDEYVGAIMKAIRDNDMEKNTVVIFISDHGGINKGHGGKTMQEMEVPYVLWGKPIKAGYTIPESLMVYDNASTIAYILGLKQPQVWIGRPARSAFK